MNCTLYLVRHGIAEHPSAATRDDDRHLTAAGTRQMTQAAHGLRSLGVAPDVVLASPLPRARETARLIASAVAPELTIETYRPLAPGHTATQVLSGLAVHRAAGRVMLVGHQPTMSELASLLLTGSTELVLLAFQTGAVAAIDVANLPPDFAGTLRWFLEAEQLCALARPA